MIEITDDDIEAMWEAFAATVRTSMVPVAQALVARHPEWQAQRPMHEPVSNAEAVRMLNAAIGRRRSKATAAFSEVAPPFPPTPDEMAAAGNALLAGRTAPQRVVVTEEMAEECVNALACADGGRGATVYFALKWLADRLNGVHEKPVDPRAAELSAILDRLGVPRGKEQTVVANEIAALFEAKP